jgi:glutamine synthetase
MTVLNTIVAKQLVEFHKDVEAIAEKGERKDGAILSVLRRYIAASKNILFEGDNYSDEWAAEAEKRGLKNIKTTPLALDAYISESAERLFVDNGIFNKSELHARHEIMLEDYIKKVQIEARTMGELATSLILPSAVKYQNVLIENINGLKASGLKEASYSSQLRVLEQISNHINAMSTGVQHMIEERKKANVITDTRQKAIAYCDNVKGKYFDEIRYHVDKLEMLVDDTYWLLPKYREMLFLR